MGDMVNLSARLMAAAGENQVYVDEVTYEASKKSMEFEARAAWCAARFRCAQELEPLELKGKENKARAFKPLGLKRVEGSKKSKNSLHSREEVGHRGRLVQAHRPRRSTPSCRA